MRRGLTPFNSEYPIVKIKYTHNAGYMDEKYVAAALDAFEKRSRVVSTGIDEFNDLEKFALWVLLDSANIDWTS